jgi:hypothetical protein
MAGETSSSLRTFANIRMKQINVFPLVMLLIIVLGLVYWLGSV